jgi:hypothetical protein
VLCQQIALGKDRQKFLELVKQLDDLLEKKSKRLESSSSESKESPVSIAQRPRLSLGVRNNVGTKHTTAGFGRLFRYHPKPEVHGEPEGEKRDVFKMGQEQHQPARSAAKAAG